MKIQVLIIFLLGLFFFSPVLSQTSYSIYYSPFDSSNAPYSRLVFNDSISYYYLFETGLTDPFKKNTVLGDKMRHHGVVSRKSTGEIFSTVYWSKKMHYLYTIDLPFVNWIESGNGGTHLGYPCKEAYAVNSKGDTCFVRYTEALPFTFGPLFYFGVPGVVLEAYNPSRNHYFLATKIEKGNQIVVFPSHENFVSRERHVKNVKSKKYRY